jgi:hypothetical protein
MEVLGRRMYDVDSPLDDDPSSFTALGDARREIA